MKFVVAVTCLTLLAACQPPASSRAASPPTPRVAESCVGSSYRGCIVYASGAMPNSLLDRELIYQLQGTGSASAGENKGYCKGGYCAVAILKRQSGPTDLIAHVESVTAQWFEPPEIVTSPAGTLVVFRSNSLGSGNYNDDIVFREDKTGTLHRVDVNTWKDEARRLAPDANSHFDWQTDYRALVGEAGLASTDPRDGARTSIGMARVFLVLDGDRLTIGSPIARFPKAPEQ